MPRCYTSPEQRSGKPIVKNKGGLKARFIDELYRAIGARWDGPSALMDLAGQIPGAMPRAGMGPRLRR